MADTILKAIYETKRQHFLVSFVQNPEYFSRALAYAYEHRIDPILHEAIQREDHAGDPFEDIYRVKGVFVKEVIDHIDTLARDGNYEDMSFSRLLKKFEGTNTTRTELKAVLEYMSIEGQLDDKDYTAIAKMSPSDGKSLKKTFEPRDVHFS